MSKHSSSPGRGAPLPPLCKDLAVASAAHLGTGVPKNPMPPKK